MSAKNNRVGAILSTDKDAKVVKFLGYGELLGCEVPDADAMGVTKNVRESGGVNPKILLDNGKVVWGAECWWGNEDKIQSEIKTRKNDGFDIIVVDIDEERQKQRIWRLKNLKVILERSDPCAIEECKAPVDFWIYVDPFFIGTLPSCDGHKDDLCKHFSMFSNTIKVITNDEYMSNIQKEVELLEQDIKKFE